MKHATMMISCLVILMTVGSAVSQETRRLTLPGLGRVEAPDDWIMQQEDNGIVSVNNQARTTVAEFRRLPEPIEQSLTTYLEEAAERIGIPPFARTIDRNQLALNEVEQGYFVHGTVVVSERDVNSGEETGSGEEIQDEYSQPRGGPAVYHMVVVYRKNGHDYLLTARTENVPEDVLRLNSLQRTWKPE